MARSAVVSRLPNEKTATFRTMGYGLSLEL